MVRVFLVVLERGETEKYLGLGKELKNGALGSLVAFYREFLLNKITFSTDLSKHVIIVEITFRFEL